MRFTKKVLETKAWFIILNIFVIYSLVADYIRILFFRKEVDPIIDVFTMIVFVSFCLEICMYCFATKDYICKFYFWIDIISTVLLILDLTFVSNSVFYSSDTTDNASKVVTRLGKYFRVIRLIRILKLLKDSPEMNNMEDEETNYKVCIISISK